MWVNRNPDEIAKSIAVTRSEALTHGLMVGAGVWLLSATVLASSWLVSLSFGIVLRQGDVADFWSRLPASALVTLPFAGFAFWFERRKALKRDMERTVCLQCESVGNAAVGSKCPCGGTFIERKSVKWVEIE